MPGDERVQLMAPVLDRYKRRFSVLDLGCGDGAVLREIAERYDAVTIGLDREPGNGAMLQKDVDADDLLLLGRLEHFDVVLALNFLHHFADRDWRLATDAVLGMGVHVFVQLPPQGTERVAGEEILGDLLLAVDQSGARLLGVTWYESFQHRRPLWHAENPITKELPPSSRPWRVTATWGEIVACRNGQERPWIPGINLWSMRRLGADAEWLRSLVQEMELPRAEHGDIRPWNIIWDGTRVHLIDSQHEPLGHRSGGDDEGVRETLRLLAADEEERSRYAGF